MKGNDQELIQSNLSSHPGPGCSKHHWLNELVRGQLIILYLPDAGSTSALDGRCICAASSLRTLSCLL